MKAEIHFTLYTMDDKSAIFAKVTCSL